MATTETLPAHSPGPWHVELAPNGRPFVTNTERQHVCTLYEGNYPTRNAANASLVAAAPQLLKACEELLERLNLCCCLHAYDERVIRRAEKVLDKAYGKAS